MKQLTVNPFADKRVALMKIIHEYDERIAILEDKSENWELLDMLYNERKGIVKAFETVFDEKYDEYG